MNKINQKIFASVLLCVILISTCSNTILAITELSDAYIQKIGDAEYHLKYYKEEKGISTYVICDIVGHYYQGDFYPAYCLNKELGGVGKAGNYSVDIESIMQNDKVWRAIKNGYPYKKAADLGLSSDYDAFVVTKMAVYCVTGQSRLEYFSADDNDAEGQAMLIALKRLVDIGNNGSETQSSSLKIIKNGDFVEDGDYYSIKYKVQSTVEIKNYTVTEISNLPEGTLVTDVDGNIKTSLSGIQEFKIKIPKNKLSSDIKGKIYVKAESKTYPIFYGKTRISGTQNYVLTGDSYGAQIAEIDVEVKLNNGKVVVSKMDSETKKPVEGITFALLDQKNNVLQTATTNSEGKVEFTNLYQGAYIVKETKTNEEYEINDNEFSINVEYNKTANLQVENKHTSGILKIRKVDKDNNGIALENIKFDLYSQELAKVVGTYSTDKNGEIIINNLRTGKYSLIEKETNKWYNASDSTQIEIKANTTTEVKVENELKKGMAKIEKVDSENNSIKISGVKFEVFDQNMNKLEEITTNSKGIAYTSKYAVRDYQKLYIKEKETDKAYRLDEKTYEVSLKENDTTNITIANQRKKGKIKVVKVDKDNNEVMLEGVELNILNSKGQVVDTIKTDSKGEATTKELPLEEEYTVVETKTKENYTLTKETQKIKLEEEQIKNLKFENEKKKGTIKVIKVDKDNSEVYLEGVEFNILNSKGEVIDTILTNEKGEAQSKKIPIDEEYTVVETKTKENYLLTGTPQKVKLQENQITTLKFENEKRKGTIKVIKIDKDNNEFLLEGVEFNILNSKGNVVDTIVTNEKGEAESKRLPIDDEYTAIETKTKENYVLTDERKTVTLEENQITNIIFENEKKKGTIKVIKVDKDNNEVLLEGIEFNILNSKGEVVDTIVTNELGEAESIRLPIDDEYTAVETKTQEIYQLAEEPQTAKLQENQITALKFENEKRKGRIKIIKVDKDNNEVLLEGVEFNILNSKGEIVDIVVTNKEGEAETKGLPIDEEYTVVETKTKENYVLTEEKQTVTLEENQITNITFENEKKKGTIKVIKVDKDDNEVLLEGVEFNLLNSKGEVVDTIVTNEKGEAESIRLPIDDQYTAVETKTQEIYLLTEEPQTAKLEENQITTLKFENEKKKGKIKIVKTSKDDNVVTGETAGTPLEGVEFEIADEKNNLIQTIKTDSKGIAISAKLPLGKYKVKETKTGEWYVLDETYHEASIVENEEIVTMEIKNDSIKPEVELEKKGPEKAQPNEEIKYEFTMKNASNTKLDNFNFVDKLPTEYIKAKKIETGTYTNASKYDLYYKTNMTNEYVLLMEDLSSTENNEIDFSKELADNEFVTEIKFHFKTVDIGFKTETSPLIYAKVNSNVKSEDTFINESFVEGDYHGFKVTDESKWKTMCYKILPLTGM